jgi:hypothetical protein
LKRLKGKGRIMNKIKCLRIFGMLNFNGLSLWWMNKGRYQNRGQGKVVG